MRGLVEAAMRTAWALLVVTMTLGCGAKFDTSGDDGGAHDAGGGDDGGGQSDGGGGDDGGAWSPVCPAAVPAVGTACSPEALVCEYGTSMYTACNTIRGCVQRVWQVAVYPGGTCPWGPNPRACAGSFGDVPRGALCGPQGIECDYPQGACRCEIGRFGPPPPQDGGGPLPTWHCDDPTPGCPSIRPRVGSTCSGGTPNMFCMYRECSFGEECTDGYWQAATLACAGGTR